MSYYAERGITSKYYYSCKIMLLKRIKRCCRCWYNNLAAKTECFALKAEVDKLDINPLNTSASHI